MGNIITGLDIGSYEIRAALVKIENEDGPQLLGVAKSPSRGIKKGIVVDIHEAAGAIDNTLRNLEALSGMRVSKVVTSVNGVNLQSVITKGIIAVSRADREISESDMERALKAAQTASLAPNREILNIIPRDFTIDNEEGIKNPVGMSGVRLEVNTVIVTASSAFLRNLSKAIDLSGWKVGTCVPGPIASAEAVISRRQKDLGVLVCDIGSDTTGVVIYEDGELVHLEVLPVGAGLITSDIAIGLRIDIDTAEMVKIKYGTALSDQVRKTEVIELNTLGFGEDLRVRRQEVSEIIQARIKEIFALVVKVLEYTGKKNFLPAGVVLVGAGSKLEGIIGLAREQLRLPVRIGYPENFKGLVDQVTDPAFARVMGLITWEASHTLESSEEHMYPAKIGKAVRGFFQRVLP